MAPSLESNISSVSTTHKERLTVGKRQPVEELSSFERHIVQCQTLTEIEAIAEAPILPLDELSVDSERRALRLRDVQRLDRPGRLVSQLGHVFIACVVAHGILCSTHRELDLDRKFKGGRTSVVGKVASIALVASVSPVDAGDLVRGCVHHGHYGELGALAQSAASLQLTRGATHRPRIVVRVGIVVLGVAHLIMSINQPRPIHIMTATHIAQEMNLSSLGLE